MTYNFESAKKEDAKAVMALYSSLIGTEGCIWNEAYPSLDDVEGDIEKGALYCAIDESGKIIAAAGFCVDEEVDEVGCFSRDFKSPCCLYRVGVSEKYWGRGIASELIRFCFDEAKLKGFDSMILCVSPKNRRAVALYERLGFKCCGECVLFEIDWLCYELKLK